MPHAGRAAAARPALSAEGRALGANCAVRGAEPTGRPGVGDAAGCPRALCRVPWGLRHREASVLGVSPAWFPHVSAPGSAMWLARLPELRPPPAGAPPVPLTLSTRPPPDPTPQTVAALHSLVPPAANHRISRAHRYEPSRVWSRCSAVLSPTGWTRVSSCSQKCGRSAPRLSSGRLECHGPRAAAVRSFLAVWPAWRVCLQLWLWSPGP